VEYLGEEAAWVARDRGTQLNAPGNNSRNDANAGAGEGEGINEIMSSHSECEISPPSRKNTIVRISIKLLLVIRSDVTRWPLTA
jgi:hypothetical protein